MSLQILKLIRDRASHMACGSALYNWSLNGPAPERMVIQPVDSWPGCKVAGRALCEGVMLFDGAQLSIGEQGWEPPETPAAMLEYLHGFGWLRDLRALSGERGMGAVARTHAKMMIQSWIDHYARWEAMNWRIDITGERLAMWLSAYEFFSAVEFIGADEEEEFQEMFFDSVMRQARHISRSLQNDTKVDPCGFMRAGRFAAAKGLLYTGIAFEGYEAWITQALAQFEQEIDAQILGDGGHISRSPATLLSILKTLLDVRIVLQAADYPLPDKIQHAIDRMGPALRFFQGNDKHFALFHGAQEGDADCISSVLRQAHVRGKTLSALPCTGYERLTLGRTSLIMDVGAGPGAGLSGARGHAAPLAFEMSYGRERLFVNCGSHPFDADWQDALRSTPAHTALSLDDRSAYSTKSMGHFARKAFCGKILREDLKQAVLLEASHNGYEALNGFTHKRRLYLCEQGHDLRGEDVLSASAEPAKPVRVAVRFHLHPRVMVSLIREGQEALLRLPGGVGWRFHLQGGFLSLEDSVYLGQGIAPRKTKQLVIYAQVCDAKAQIKWALQREG